jgi:transposase-like protein
MSTGSSQDNPNPNRRHNQNDTSQEDATLSEDADDLREILKNFEPEKGFLDDEDIALIKNEIEKRRAAAGLDESSKTAPNLRVVQSDQPDGETATDNINAKPADDGDEPLPFVRIREGILRDVLLRRIRGEPLVEIARYYHKSARTIRRWLREAQRRQLVCIDKMKPAQELAETLLALKTQRAKLMDLRDQFLERDQFDRALKVIDKLIKLEDTINRIEHRVGLFVNYIWGEPSDWIPGSPSRQRVDDGEFLEVDDYDPRKSGQNRTKHAS